MKGAILVLNAGSSSLKFAVYEPAHDDLTVLLRGKIAGLGSNPVFTVHDGQGHVPSRASALALGARTGIDDLVPTLFDWLKRELGDIAIAAAGHRVVHGGRDHRCAALVTAKLLDELEALVPLAPLHQPHNLAAIRSVSIAAPAIPQVAAFDTSFHRTQNRLAEMFAIPRDLTDAGIIRYGFHGLSYGYIAGILPRYLGGAADGRVIVAHLGNGASLCAMKERRSVATSMGFTALDGLMMGNRCGAIDPGVILYLQSRRGMTLRQVERLLYEESGLLGVSGISNDMAVLEASDASEARQAIELFCYRAASELSALVPAIGGLDALVFTAGIGENSALVRSQICRRLTWLGIEIDEAANSRSEARIGVSSSKVDVLVLKTNEEGEIASMTRGLT